MTGRADRKGGPGHVVPEDVLELDRLGRRWNCGRVELGQLRVLVEDVVELALEPVELLVGEAEACEEGDVLDVSSGESGHRRMILNGVPSPASVIPTLRAMQPEDVAPAAEMILGQGWGVRREWLEFATTQSQCVPMVAEAQGGVVATGVGTANGPVGWIGTIFVAPERRGRGLGRAITQAIIDRLDAAGCATLVLVATSEGRRLYERMGFEVQTRYRILEAPGLAGDAADATGAAEDGYAAVRPYAPGDLAALAALDREATGEDRGHALARLASPDTARVLSGPDGVVHAFVVRPPWGGGATVATSIEAALAIISARRVAAGREGRVRVGILAENRRGHAALVKAGFRAQWSAPRMVRGAPLAWQPEMIWGQLNHATG